jgi:hypothetical protein
MLRRIAPEDQRRTTFGLASVGIVERPVITIKNNDAADFGVVRRGFSGICIFATHCFECYDSGLKEAGSAAYVTAVTDVEAVKVWLRAKGNSNDCHAKRSNRWGFNSYQIRRCQLGKGNAQNHNKHNKTPAWTKSSLALVPVAKFSTVISLATFKQKNKPAKS